LQEASPELAKINLGIPSADFSAWASAKVAVNPSAVKVIYNDRHKKWHATMNATADQLKSAPEFKYIGRRQGNRT